jgi:iron complex outermembrane recepter protein
MIQHPIRGRLFIAIVLFVGLLWDMGAQAQDEVMDFDIPGQALSSALKTFADQADLQLLYESEVVEGRQTTGVMGRFTSQEALRRLLSGTGTGLLYSFTDANTVTLQKPNPPQAAVGEEADDAEAKDFRQKPIKLPEVIVKEVHERDDATSYVAEEANTATRTDTPLIQVPQSIQVATRKLMDDQKAIRVEQALRNVSGVALGDIGQSGNRRRCCLLPRVPLLIFQELSSERRSKSGAYVPGHFQYSTNRSAQRPGIGSTVAANPAASSTF